MKKYAFIIVCLMALSGAQAQDAIQEKPTITSPELNRPTQSRPDTSTQEGINSPAQPAKEAADKDKSYSPDKSAVQAPIQTPDRSAAEAQTPGQISDESAGAKNSISALGEMSESDRTMSTHIRHGLTSSTTITGVPAETWKAMVIHVKEGAVTLNGQVQSEEQKKNIEAEVKKMTGVQSVKNNLSVRSDSSTDTSIRSDSDAQAPGTAPAGADSSKSQSEPTAPARPSDTDRQPEGSGTGKSESDGTLK